MCRHANLIEEAVQALNNGGDLLGQIAGVHSVCEAASSKSRRLNGPSSEEMPARNAEGSRRLDRAMLFCLFRSRVPRAMLGTVT